MASNYLKVKTSGPTLANTKQQQQQPGLALTMQSVAQSLKAST
jgi:hypothetical protein